MRPIFLKMEAQTALLWIAKYAKPKVDLWQLIAVHRLPKSLFGMNVATWCV